MKTLFVSDLHLDAASPEIARQFHGFLESEAPSAEGLYILGDLFEAWLGDDDPDPAARATVRALRALVEALRLPSPFRSCRMCRNCLKK